VNFLPLAVFVWLSLVHLLPARFGAAVAVAETIGEIDSKAVSIVAANLYRFMTPPSQLRT
jgi:hypothetical protein